MERWLVWKTKFEDTKLFHILQLRLLEDEWYSHVLVELERFCGVNRVYLVFAFLTVLGLKIVLGCGGNLICNVVGFAYPAYKTVHTTKFFDRLSGVKWLIYWTVFSLFSVVEFFSFHLFQYFSSYWIIKCAVLTWCFAPNEYNGSAVLYFYFIRPFLTKDSSIPHKITLRSRSETKATTRRSSQMSPTT